MQVSCGDNFTLVLTDKHQVWAFGKCTHGRLGVGNTQDCEYIEEPELVESLKKEKVV